jgi:hypothetical protein
MLLCFGQPVLVGIGVQQPLVLGQTCLVVVAHIAGCRQFPVDRFGLFGLAQVEIGRCHITQGKDRDVHARGLQVFVFPHQLGHVGA